MPRTSITRRSHQCASICPWLGSPSVKPFLCLPWPLPFLVKDWSFDCSPLPELCPLSQPLGEMCCCLILPQPLSDFFLCQCSFLWNESFTYSFGCAYLSPSFRKRPDVFLSSSLQLAPPTMIRGGLGKSCTTLRGSNIAVLALHLPLPLLLELDSLRNTPRILSSTAICRNSDGFINDMSLTPFTFG